LAILGEHSSDKGIAPTFNLWKKSGKSEDRSLFFSRVLSEGVGQLEKSCGAITEGMPLLCSGMASSSMGIVELPYANLPFALDGSNAIVNRIAPSKVLPNPLYIISGLKSNDDVMRGEETELTGLSHVAPGTADDYLAILPGTHSKHIRVQSESIVEFNTYMSGEVFTLLATQSTLSHSVELASNVQWNAFEEGLDQSGSSPLLRNLFRVRALEVLGKADKTHNYFFLSGLVIGAELREVQENNHVPIVIAGNSKLQPLYSHALRYMDFPRITEIPEVLNDLAVPAGQLHILQHYSKRHD
jgi:2-dehydro-3-deoxygalactonokinase